MGILKSLKSTSQILLLVVVLSTFLGFSSDSFALKSSEVEKIAQQRLYPGGVDEEDLKVQEDLKEPVRKLYPSTIQNKYLKNLVKKKKASKGQ